MQYDCTITKKQVRAVLGLRGYISNFVPQFSMLMKLLTDVTGNKETTKVRWTDACNTAFEKVKEILTCKPVLQLPNLTRVS